MNKRIANIIFLAGLFFCCNASAAISNRGVLDTVLDRYQSTASAWAGTMTTHATWLFWTLATISMVWTFGLMALRKADIAEFFSEFIKFTLFVGFYWWLLINGPKFASDIIDSLRQIAGEASGGAGLSPSGVVDVGFAIFDAALEKTSFWEPLDSLIAITISCIILVVLALVGINMLLMLVSAWILAFGGVFFLGFGGSRWTSDMAINYYKTVLGIAAQLFGMILLVGIGKSILDNFYLNMDEGLSISELGVLLIVSIVLLVLTDKVPALIAGIVSGGGVGSQGIGSFGAGAAMGAAGMAIAGAATAGGLIAAGATQMAGGAQALMNAASKASSNVAAGSDTLGKMMSGASSAGSFADAAGFGGSSSGSTGADGGSGSTGADGGSGSGSGSTGGDGGSGSGSTGADGGSGSGSAGADGGSGSGSAGADGSSGSGSAGTNGGSGSGSGSSAKSSLAKAGRVAAETGVVLGKAVGASVKNKAQSLIDSAKERVSQTAGGRLAQEINNPGAKAQERLDNKTISEASAIKAQEERQAQASEARAFLDSRSGNAEQSQQETTENSLSGEMESEIAAFRDRK